MTLLNLEPMAATAAHRMVSTDPKLAENLITKAVAVLAEQGVYALGLFLGTRKEKEQRAADDIDKALRKLLKDTDLEPAANDPGSFYQSISAKAGSETEIEALRRLLLTKQLLETALTYGRYHAKAMGKSS